MGVLLGFVVRLWVRSLRFRLVYDGWDPADYPVPWFLAFLHGQQMALLRWRRRRETLVLVSLSRDGELQSHVMAAQGLEVVRGSTSRGGARALAAIVRRLDSTTCSGSSETVAAGAAVATAGGARPGPSAECMNRAPAAAIMIARVL